MKDVYTKFIGKRIRLISTSDEYTSLKSGDVGIINYIDDTGTIFAEWDNGSSLGLIPDVDRFEIIFDGEIL
jgi:hypothetical protein